MLLGHLTSDAFLRIDDDYTSDLCANESRSSFSFLNMVVVFFVCVPYVVDVLILMETHFVWYYL